MITDRRSPSVIVFGLGTMGAATCLELARRGVRVVGIDRFEPPHALGSHHGGSRIVRDCYIEHPDYVPLLLRAREGWGRLEHDARAVGALGDGPLVHRPGVLYLGHAGSDVVERSAASGEANGIACDRFGPRDICDRFPQFEVPGDWRALFEPGAGFVRPERAVAAAIALARELGAEIRTEERVLEWSETPGGVRVRTDRATLDADALVIAAGAWTPTLAVQLGVPLVPQRVVIAWLAPRDAAACAAPRMPVWYVDRPGAPGLYGIPTAPDQGDPPGMKVAFHAGTPCDPDAPPVPPTDAELRALADATAEFVPAAAGPVASSATCLYTMSPDGNFIVDRMPGATRTWIACGFSGHGFKFMPVMGEALADLATAGSTRLPVDFLRIRR